MEYNWDVARENLKKIRQDNGLSIYALEKELNWCYSSISSYEVGRNIPKINYLIDFCNYFKMSIEDLFKKEL